MKNLILFLSLFLVFSCNKEENEAAKCTPGCDCDSTAVVYVTNASGSPVKLTVQGKSYGTQQAGSIVTHKVAVPKGGTASVRVTGDVQTAFAHNDFDKTYTVSACKDVVVEIKKY